MSKQLGWRILITIFLIIYVTNTNGQSYPKVSTVATLDSLSLPQLYSTNDLERIRQGLLMVEKFLKEKDISSIDSISNMGREIIKSITEFAPLQNVSYEIVAVSFLRPYKIIYSVNAYIIFNQSPEKIYKGLFEIGVDLQQKKIVFPIYSSLYTSINRKNISFRVPNSILQKCLPNLDNCDSFVLSIFKYIKEKYPGFRSPTSRVNYILANGYFNGLEYFGVHNFLVTSRFYQEANTIVDVSSNGFYKHELIHYIFSKYKFCYFLDEGVATFLSGGESKYGEDPIKSVNVIKNRIRVDSEYASRLNSNMLLSDYSVGREMYMISALLIYNYTLKFGNTKFYRVLFSKLYALSNEEVLEFFKSNLKITKISDFILTAETPLWNSVYHHLYNF